MLISSTSGDITALALRLTSLKAGIGAEATGAAAPRRSGEKTKEGEPSSPGRGPAVVLDERTARLADAAAEAEVSGKGRASSPSWPLSDARREMIAAAAQSLEAWHRQVRDIGETIDIYEKTGRVVQIQTTFSEGNHKFMGEMDERALKPWGGAEGFMTMLRERRERVISTVIPEAERVHTSLASGE